MTKGIARKLFPKLAPFLKIQQPAPFPEIRGGWSLMVPADWMEGRLIPDGWAEEPVREGDPGNIRRFARRGEHFRSDGWASVFWSPPKDAA